MMLKLPPPPLRRIARFLAVIAIALAAGHLVQTLAARKPATQALAQVNTPVKVVQLSAGADDQGLVAPLLTPKAEPAPVLASADPVATQAQPQPLAAPAEPQPATTEAPPQCTATLSLRQQPGAMIGLVLDANCHPNERVVLRHAGLNITGKTDADGRLTTALPALAADGQVAAVFTDGETADAAIAMPETVLLRRFGVQWQGAPAFVVHAFQNGSDYGQSGDISPMNPGQTVAAMGGFLNLLGDASVDNPLMAQIYTYPMDPTAESEVVVEASVTKATCGNDLVGQTLLSERGKTATADLTLAMPDCSGVGDFLVLKNLATDMKIAAN